MTKIAFLGDSITASANVSLADQWAYKVGIFNGYAAADIINAGVPGNTTADMLTRLQMDVINQAPAVCVMMMTVNDKTHGLTLAQHETNVRSIISQLQAAGIKVVIASPPLYRSGLDSWKAWIEKDQEISGDLHLPYVDVWREYAYAYFYSPSFDGLYSDGLVHQSVGGNALIASVMQRKTYDGIFLPDVPQSPSGEIPELTAALSDLQLNGVTPARLSRVINAMQ